MAIEEFLKQGVHNRVAARAGWPVGTLLVQNGEGVAKVDLTGIVYDLSDADLDATDWTLNEHEFL